MNWRNLPSRVEATLAQSVTHALGMRRLRRQKVEVAARARMMGVPVVGAGAVVTRSVPERRRSHRSANDARATDSPAPFARGRH